MRAVMRAVMRVVMREVMRVVMRVVMRAPARVLMLALVLAQAGRAARAQEPAPDPRLRAEVLVRPESATVGDPVTIIARVTAPRGATVEFPVAVGLGANVEALDPRFVRVRSGGDETVAEATWRVIGWRPGTHALPLGEAVVTVGTRQYTLPLETRMLAVRSVLPADTALRVPRPARASIEVGAVWYDRLWVVALAIVVLLLARRAWRRRRRARAPAPEAVAMASLDRLDAMGLAAAGEPAREVALAAEIVRAAMEARWPEATRGLTTAQAGAAAHRRIGPLADDIVALLVDADLVKFARRPVTAAEARAFTARARRVLHELEARMPRTGRAA